MSWFPCQHQPEVILISPPPFTTPITTCRPPRPPHIPQPFPSHTSFHGGREASQREFTSPAHLMLHIFREILRCCFTRTRNTDTAHLCVMKQVRKVQVMPNHFCSFGLRIVCFVLHLVMEQNDGFVSVSPHLLLQLLVRSDAGCPGLSDLVDVGVVIWTRAYRVCSVDSRLYQPVEQDKLLGVRG